MKAVLQMMLDAQTCITQAIEETRLMSEKPEEFGKPPRGTSDVMAMLWVVKNALAMAIHLTQGISK